MAESQHFRELLLCFRECEVEFLIVGAYAAMKYSEPRYTKDLDLWVASSAENSARVFRALANFGAPLAQDGVTPETFTEEGVVYQVGVAPVRVDILTRISGLQFPEAWRDRVESVVFGVPVNFLSLNDLIASKRAAGRSSDLRDLKRIQKEQRKKK
ncbi:MAG: nucleotidyltransferase [Bryobacteraceae bacterium]